MEEGLRFEENSGKMEFVYIERIDDRSHRQVNSEIPERVVKQGKKAIRDYAQKKVNQYKKKWKRAYEIEEDIRKNNIPIQTNYKDGTSLEGRIVEAANRIIRIELDSPLKGKDCINFGFASSMFGHYVFTEENFAKIGV